MQQGTFSWRAAMVGGVAVGLALAGAQGAVSGPSVYLQAPIVPAPGQQPGGGLISGFAPAELSARHVAQGVLLAQTTSITSLRFWGYNSGFLAAPSSRFRISVWRGDSISSNGLPDAPGTLVFQQVIAITDPRVEQFIPPNPTGFAQEATRTEIDLGAGFTGLTLQGGQRYWLAIAGSEEARAFGGGAMEQTWAWRDSTSSTGYSAVYNVFSADSWFSFAPQPGIPPGGGLAFEIFGVPTPGAAAVLALAGVTALRRRRS
jgi:MYXO-CTERM domain-containing protein